MDWLNFQTYGESKNKAFEAMCNQLFEKWCHREYCHEQLSTCVINGDGGDGGVESVAVLQNGTVLGLQAKWFPGQLKIPQFNQIRKSIITAISVYPKLTKYVVCIPQSLTGAKKSRDGKTAKQTEWKQWIDLLTNVHVQYPDLEIILWDEMQILQQLQNTDCIGVYAFWFEKAVLTDDIFIRSYERNRDGWLRSKYISQLHGRGEIFERATEFIGDVENRKRILSDLITVAETCQEFIRSADDLIALFQHMNDKDDLKEELRKQKEIILLSQETVDNTICHLMDDSAFDEITGNKQMIFMHKLKQLLHDNHHIRKQYYHVHHVETSIEKIENINWSNLYCTVKRCLNYKKLIIIGTQGTGKTHGLADVVEEFSAKYHHAVLIRAKTVNEDDNWREIICTALDLDTNLTLEQILNMLESTASLKDVVNAKTNAAAISVRSKILICVDGLDELKPYEKWLERINESDAISANHPKVMFCFSSRPYFFNQNKHIKLLDNNTLHLYDTGDTKVSSIYDKYIKYYNINDNMNRWIKWTLKTPFDLHLFCDIYKNSNLSDNASVILTTSTDLLEKRIETMEMEFSKLLFEIDEKDNTISRILSEFAYRYVDNEWVERDVLINNIIEKTRQCYPRLIIVEAIGFLENYGVLQSYQITNRTGIVPLKVTMYSIGIQPFFDYVIAKAYYEKIDDPSQEEIPYKLIYNRNGNAARMFTLLLLEKKSYLIGKNEKMNELFEDDTYMDLSNFALANASISIARQLTGHIKLIMKHDANTLRKIVNEIIMPVSRQENHPFGARMFNEFCMGFSTPIQRDMIWSVPDLLYSDNGRPNWQNYTALDLQSASNELCIDDQACGLPIIYAWALTSLSQEIRSFACLTLAKWACLRQDEFFKLFELAILSNDPQMQVDLCEIAMAVVIDKDCPRNVSDNFGLWFLENVFSVHIISQQMNSAIRYYGRNIEEWRYHNGWISEQEIKQCQPPYITNNVNIGMNKAAMSGTRMSGFRPFDYDLSRYVLCDPISYSFFDRNFDIDTFNSEEKIDVKDYYSENEIVEILKSEKCLSEEARVILKKSLEQYEALNKSWHHLLKRIDLHVETKNSNEESEKDLIEASEELVDEHTNISEIMNKEMMCFLRKHADYLGVDKLSDVQFILCAAYEYLLSKGWDEQCEGEYDETGVHIPSFDSAIRGQYHAATHGSKSSVMSPSEKYTWMSRYVLLGYLADRLPYSCSEYSCAFLSDYGMEENYHSVIHECIDQADNEVDAVVYQVKITEEKKDRTDNEKNLLSTLKTTDIPNFRNILEPKTSLNNQNWQSLYAFVDEERNGINNTIWESACYIDKLDMKILLAEVSKHREYISRELGNPTDLNTNVKCHCYISPVDLCRKPWIEESNYSKRLLAIVDGEFKEYIIWPTFVECTEKHLIKDEIESSHAEETSYNLPSKLVRQRLEITNCDRTHFYDEDDKIKCVYSRIGRGWNTDQIVLAADRDSLIDSNKDGSLQMIWVVRMMSELGKKNREKYSCNDRHDVCWLVWEEENEYKYRELYDKYD